MNLQAKTQADIFPIESIPSETGSVTLVCQDWGGLVGLSVLKDMKETFEAVVIMNTGLPTGGADKTMDDGLTADFLPFLVWRLSVSLAGNRLPVKFLFRDGFNCQAYLI